MSKRLGVFLAALLMPAVVAADYVRVDRSANIYDRAKSYSEIIGRIDPADSEEPIYLTVIDSELKNGYHQVELPDGGRGWIYKSRVRKFKGAASGTPLESSQGPVYGGYPDTRQLGDQTKRLESDGYVVEYSETRANPLWVAYTLGPDQGHQCERLAKFITDDRTEVRIDHDDYTGSGYDRGHMAPSANIGSRYGCEAQNQTYRLSNITPQLPRLNQKSWGALENLEEDYPKTFGKVWILTGPIFDPVWLDRMCSGVEIPAAFYKIIVREMKGKPSVLATVFSQDTAPGIQLSELVTTVDEIEAQTGIDFFASLPDGVEMALEQTRATDAAWKLSTSLNTSFKGAARPFCRQEKIKRAEAEPDQ